MDVYTPTLVVLVIILVAVILHHRRCSQAQQSAVSKCEGLLDSLDDFNHEYLSRELAALRRRFLPVYGLAIAADWLQGSFTYSLYKNTHHLTETTIASLFTTGFVSAGVGAFFAGAFADRLGRKRACLAYCCLYTLSSLLILSPAPHHLFAGRVLGGLSTTILFTAFEAWMMAEYGRLGLGHGRGRLNAMFGTMSVVNGFVAIASGLASQGLVGVFSSEKAPFLASVLCLVVAGLLISTSWVENHGRPPAEDISRGNIRLGTLLVDAVEKAADSESATGRRLLALTYITTVCEGSMYIMVFSWTGIMLAAKTLPPAAEDPPYGTIFAAFMCAMTIGSYVFKLASPSCSSLGNGKDVDALQASSQAIQTALSLAASGLVLSVFVAGELPRLLALCLFELALGVYMPAAAHVKGVVVPEAHRVTIYGAMRVPLNGLVVAVLSRARDTNASRQDRMVVCSGLLLLGAFLSSRYLASTGPGSRSWG